MHYNISEFERGKTYNGVYICKSHAVKTAKTGSQFLDMQIVDKTGEINGKCWNIPQIFHPEEMVDGDFIALVMVIEEYQGKLQARINNIRLIAPTDVFDKSEVIPTAPEPADKMYAEIEETISDMANKDLQKLCVSVLHEKEEQFLIYPGAKTMHHAVVSGLLQHMTGMLRVGKALADLYPSVNRDLLLAGIILHDVCKIDEFEIGPVGLCVDYTKQGKLLGHITMGVAYIDKKCKELNIDEETTLLIKHMILSHHGEPDFGSAVRPMFLEAILLNVIDNIDAKVYMCQEALDNTEVGSFTDRIYGMENIQLYKHGLKNDEEYRNY